MSKKDARTALVQAVITANTGGLLVKWPNAAFTTPNNAPWLRATLLSMPDLPVTLGNGGYNVADGVLQIDIFEPKDAGDIPAFNTLALMESVFKTGAYLAYNGQKVRINSAPSRIGAEDSSWWRWIIDINFTAYFTRV